MLSRTGESFFWIGRYIERAEYTARFTDVHYHLLTEIANQDEQVNTWKQYLDGTGEYQLFTKLYAGVSTSSVLEFLTISQNNPNSLVNLISAARTNARGIQDQISSEIWHFINDFYLSLNKKSDVDFWADTHNFLRYLCHTSYTLDGVFGSTMTHDEGWNFYRLGKNVERGSRTARLLDQPILSQPASETRGISEYHRCLAILKAASALEAYRKFYSAELVPRKIVQFLLFHNKFPRSVRFTTTLNRRLLERLSSPNRRPETRQAERLAGQLAADLEFGSLEEVYKTGLSEFLSQVITQLDQVTNKVGKAFFGASGYSELPTPDAAPAQRPLIHSFEPVQRVVKAILLARHQFHYKYTAPISQVTTIVRLAPPQHYGKQRRLDLRWHVDPPADYRHFTDAFGNMVWQLDHPHIEKEIACTVEMRIETQAKYQQDQVVAPQGVTPQESDCAVKPTELSQLTKLVDNSDSLYQIVRRAKGRGLSPIELATSLMNQVFAHMRYEPGETHVSTTASQAFALGVGVCQDYAHILLSLCRQVGLPARYVSGYLPGEGQMHAWVEVLLPLGPKEIPTWVPFDPTHHCRCDERYITVAVGRDYQDVAPTSGHYSGESSSQLQTTVSVVVESRGVGEYWQSPQMMLQETGSPDPSQEQ
jgi:uncharacterized alpha-E superfamily protein/transglutaminase-like putative cysteine protease